MALPRQVQKQLDEAEAIEKQLQAKAEERGQPQVAGEDDSSLEPTDSESSADPIVEAKPVVVASSEVVDPPEPTDSFEQKYRTLQGMYNADVPRLQQQLKDSAAQVDALTQDLNAVKEQLQKIQTDRDAVSLVTDADKEAFGEDLLDVQRRVAEEVTKKYEGRIDALNALVDGLKKALEDTDTRLDVADFDTRLRRLVPDYEEVNRDPRWISWLNEVDPLLRGPRRALAQEAFDRKDETSVAYFVNLFKDSLKTAAPPNTKQELERQVTAPKRSVVDVQAGTEPKTYSTAQAETLWGKVTTLYRQGKHDEANKLEAELTQAYMDGRVISP